ncbi:MAG: adenosine deaminase [Armatimonadota bacterium]|nr:adenosine deaminase [Armatimonadota bacterium]MDR7464327.1 adenosine deaminase [Armatimonadota bacterium]MDR7470705.1 adenosine deaminase [Armatimonadota bacterium]MDR7475670.1 adenosine deaminase [Armatimonadota bacterium]MDR7540352.1 adenosine deaminase [Armatimonadota bacterium]
MLSDIRILPKVELHLHLETSLRLRRLMQQRLSGDPPLEGAHLVADPLAFRGYDRLRRMRYASRTGRIPDALYTRENITRIAAEMLAAAAAQNIRYLEIRVGGRRGFSVLGVRPMLEAMAAAAGAAAPRTQAGFIVTVVRERGPEEAEQIVQQAVACRDCGVVGIDLAGDEANYPPAMFVRAVDRAREAGLGITVHAGEFTGPASVWTAIYQLGAQRIGHGIRAVEDPELLAYLREHRVTLELCPTSNLRLGLVTSLAEHPMRTLLKAGVPVTVNSDDPVLLGTDLTRELAAVQVALGLSMETVTALMRNAARAAFLPPQQRAALEEEVARPLAAS